MSPSAPPVLWEAIVEADPERFERTAVGESALEFPHDRSPRTISLDRAEIRIGRRTRHVEPEIDLSWPGPIGDPGCSRLHAFLQATPHDSYAIVDNGSLNGTTLNHGPDPIQKFVPVELQDGDQVHVGAWTTITLRRVPASYGSIVEAISTRTQRVRPAPPVADVSTETVGATTWLVCATIADSRLLRQRSTERYGRALVAFQRLLSDEASTWGGTVINTVEDRVAVSFGSADAALASSVAVQERLPSLGEDDRFQVRIGIHAERGSGRVSTRVGFAVCLAAHGGEILVSEAAHESTDAALRETDRLLDLGPFQLTDLLRPQHLYQLEHKGLEQDFPPPRSLDALPHNLPLQLTSFIGRDLEVEEMKRLVLARRLCTIEGPVGAGKTRLVLEVAAGLTLYVPEGVWFADLSAVADPALIVANVADSVGLREGGSGTYAPSNPRDAPTEMDRLVGHLQDRNLLLVLDGCERLLEGVRPVVDELLRRCPTLRILATSREPLGVPGETTYRLGALELPDPRWPIPTVRRCSSVRLFVDRARLQDPDRTFDDSEIETVAGICERVGGIPLAIELAAAQTRFLSVPQIAELLEDRMLTLDATIEWSVARLSDRERMLLRRLAVFAGGFTLDAVQHVCTGHGLEVDEVVDELGALVDRSLVDVVESVEANRYRLLEATRQHGLTELETSEEHAWLVANYVAWYVSLGEKGGDALTGADQQIWLDAIEREYDNLRAVLVSAARMPSSESMRLSSALWRFWLVRGHLSEGIGWLERALRDDPGVPPSLRSQAASAAAILAAFASDFDRAERLGMEGRELAEDQDALTELGMALTALGLVAAGRGRSSDAEAFFEEAARSASDAGDRWFESFALNSLGNMLMLRGETREAEARYREALSIRREHQDAWAMGWSLFRLGVLHTWRGHHEEAVSSLEEAFTTWRDLGYGQGSILALLGLGDALAAHDSAVEAGRRYAEALRTARELDESTSGVLAIAGLATVAIGRGDLPEAATWLTEEETLRAERSPASLAALHRVRGLLAAEEGDRAAAESAHRDALAIRRALGDRHAMLEEVELLAVLWSKTRLDRSALLLAATDADRERIGWPVLPQGQVELGPLREEIESGVDAAVSTAWKEGSGLSVEQALARASSEGSLAEIEIGPQTSLVGDPLREARRAWVQSLSSSLSAGMPSERAGELMDRYADAFPDPYWISTTGDAAADDVRLIEGSESDLRIALARAPGDPDGVLSLTLVRAGAAISISEITPRLEHMGLRLLNEQAFEVLPSGSPALWLYRMSLMRQAGGALDAAQARAFEAALERVWHGALESGSLNELALVTAAHWRDVAMLRAYTRYFAQIRQAFSFEYAERTLTAHPDVARRLIALFHIRFDPDLEDRSQEDSLAAEALAAVDAVTSLDEDRILRAHLQLILATVRTNFFHLVDDEPKDRIAFKFDPSAVPDVPEPRPAHEIFVYATATEGVHLRGGSIARGGIRWSDRLRDFRTEAAGLMHAQTLKNAVIVPVGAKGCFVVKQPPTDRSALEDEVRRCYRTFIGGLLDLTDTVVDGTVVGPPRTVRYDDDDPYLVVAADKGTGTFSDLANDISADFDFWLGDAFASGGSHGYDHKEIGITARGAWESARCHLRTIGRNADHEEITVMGIGDMSGDVFGNGLIQSDKVKLVAAFDHRHVMIDPDPDPEVSYLERLRLFGMPRSSWADVDPATLSHGGGVFPRDAKSVSLTPEIQALLGVSATALTPDELIREVMRAPVDLLYNGGIGTFVKATEETDAEVDDHTNDRIRVDADELRCAVVVEGGNLGLTQRARIAFARAGGLVNSDAIDNSAGVDCSDHEVNIKILLDRAVAADALSTEDRNGLLEEMTEEVATLVLRDNYLQNEALTRNVRWGRQVGPARLIAMQSLELAGRLNRPTECLPSDEEFNQRRQAGGDLTVPELAVLLAEAKIGLYEDLLRSDLPDDPILIREMERYFPSRLAGRFEKEMSEHMLRRAIIANSVANDLLNHLEVTFIARLQGQTERPADDIARAYVIAREIFEMRSVWAQLEGADLRDPAQTRADTMWRLNDTVEWAVRWVLQRATGPIDVQGSVDRYAEATAGLASSLPGVLGGAARIRYDEYAAELLTQGVPKELLQAIAGSRALIAAPDIVDLALERGDAVEAVAQVYFALAEALDIDEILERIADSAPVSEWEMRALVGSQQELLAGQRALVSRLLAWPSKATDAAERVKLWMDSSEWPIDRWRALMSRIDVSTADIVTLGVAARELNALAAGAVAAR